MRVRGRRLNGVHRRVAPALAGLLIFGTVAGVDDAGRSARLAGLAQAPGPPAVPEDYLARGRTTLVGDADSFVLQVEDDSGIAMSDDGRFIAFSRLDPGADPDEDPDISNVYITDRDTDQNGLYDEPEGTSTTLVTLGFVQGGVTLFFRAQPTPGPGREPADGDSYEPDISGDGRFVVFTSVASNLIPDSQDFSGLDVYRWDRLAPDAPPVWVSSRAPTGFDVEESFEPTISDDGTRVAFRHDCSFGGTSIRAFAAAVPALCRFDTILVQRIQGSALLGEPEMVPLEDPNFPGGNGVPLVCQTQQTPVLSGDGAFVFLVVRGATNQFNCQELEDHLLARFDLANPNTITALPTVFDGVTIGAFSDENFNEVISDLSASRNGQHLAFSAEFDGERQVFVRDQASGTVELISGVGGQLGVCSGAECSPDSRRPSISSDGRYVAYTTRASNILRVDVDPSRQVVVRDRLNPSAENELVSVGEFVPNGSFPQDPLPEDFLGNAESDAAAVSSHSGALGVPSGLPFVAFVSFANNLDDVADPFGAFDEDLFVRSFTSAELLGTTVPFPFDDVAVGTTRTKFVDFEANPFGFGPVMARRAFFDPTPIDFTLGPLGCPAVQPGEICNILALARFHSTALGERRQPLFVEFDSNPTIVEPDEVAKPQFASRVLVAVGAPGGLVFEPSTLAFGAQPLGIATAATPVTVLIRGEPPDVGGVTFAEIVVTGPGATDYTITADDCLGPTGVRLGDPCVVTVVFTPSAIGDRPAFIEFRSGGSGSVDLVELTGSGIQPSIILNPAVVHSGGVIGVEGLDWPPGATVRLTIPALPPVDVVVRPDGTVELPTVIFYSRNFGPREVMAEVVATPAVRLAQPVILLVQAPGADVVDLIGRN